MVEYYNRQRRNYRKDGSIKYDYRATYFRADERSVARMCNAGAYVAGMVVKSLLTMAITRNPYNLPK